MNFVVLNDIGPWRDIIKTNIPDAKFLYQSQQTALREITQYSNFPYFDTNVTSRIREKLTPNDWVRLLITDDAAEMTFYASYLKKSGPSCHCLLKSWKQHGQSSKKGSNFLIANKINRSN